jgi:hypothetical protein
MMLVQSVMAVIGALGPLIGVGCAALPMDGTLNPIGNCFPKVASGTRPLLMCYFLLHRRQDLCLGLPRVK